MLRCTALRRHLLSGLDTKNLLHHHKGNSQAILFDTYVMKRSLFLITLLLVSLFSVSCSQKMPVPSAPDTGLLVIPVTSNKWTPYQYGYYYTLLYTPETDIEMKVVPLGSRNFVLIENMPAGSYDILGIKAIAATNADGGLPQTRSETTEFSRSIPIEITSNQVTILNYHLTIEQKFLSSNDTYRYTQGFFFQPLKEVQQTAIIKELKSLQNAELWNLDNVAVSDIPEEGEGVTSSSELQIVYSGWGRRS